jgi:Ras-related protein Rab-32
LIIILKDIAGQERFGSMTRVYYKEALGCIIVFDVTRASTFEAVSKWKVDLDNKVQLPNGNRVPCILLANKVFTIRNIYNIVRIF